MNFIQVGKDRFILNPVDVYYPIDINQLKYKTPLEELWNDPVQLIIENIDELKNYNFELNIDELIIVGNQLGHEFDLSVEVGIIKFVKSLEDVELPEVLAEYKMKDWE